MIAAVPPSANEPAEPEAPKGAGAKTAPRDTPPFVAICVYLFIVFLGTAIVAPRLHATAQFLFQEVSWRFGRLAGQPFHRFLNGTFILLAMIALPSLLRSLQVRSARDLGLPVAPRSFAEGIQGAAWALIGFLLLNALMVASGVRVLDLESGLPRWRDGLGKLALSSLGVAFMVELIFRGAFFNALRRRHAFWTAAVGSAVFGALLPFLQRPPQLQRVEWTSGFAALSGMFAIFTEPGSLVPGILNAAILGVLAALALERTGALYFSIGLHAGALFCLKSFSLLTNASAGETSSFWGSDKLVDGWAATLLLIIVFLLIERTLPPRKPAEP